MGSKSNNPSSGVGFIGALCLIFITLKLCGVITWSWWWILSPVWMPFCVAMALLALWEGVQQPITF